ncbi:MAG: Acetylserotonin O-methyltransferase [Acidobacteria bacterium]|nr:Acetylserotonin O-methyltransferase [Acidobacteriota bacterium]
MQDRGNLRQATGASADSFPDELMQSIRAFQDSRVILTGIELDVFTAIGAGATALDVARSRSTDVRGTEMLLNALVALGLLEKTGAAFRNSQAAAQFLAGDSPRCARTALLHTVHLWDRWSTLTECVRTGTAVLQDEIKDRGEAWTEAFIAAMDRNARERAPAVVRAVGAEGVRTMLDVGGGSAAYSISFAEAAPGLEAVVLDLPGVVPIAQGHVERAGLDGRVRIRAGDLRTDPLGRQDYELVLVSAICHMLGPAENRDLIARSFSALKPGGRIAIQDFILEPDKTSPRQAAMFSLNMLVGTEAGASYSVDEYTGWLEGAGFHKVARISLPGPADLMVGEKPASP